MRSDSPRSVLWLHSHFLLPAGGTKYIFEVTSRLAQRRPVEVMVEAASPLWRERYETAGVKLREIGGATSMNLGYWAAFPLMLRRDLAALHDAAASADVLVSSFFPMPWLASQAARQQGKPHLSLCFEPFPFFHDTEVIGMYPAMKRTMLAFLRTAYGGLDAAGLRGADSLLTLNKATASQIEKTYGVPNALPAYAGVDTDLFRPYSDAELADLRVRLGEGRIVVHSTDFSPIKRTDLALEAFAVAVQGVPDSRLVITSTREDPTALRTLLARADELGVGDRVQYVGFLPYEDLPRLYSLAAALLQTGTSEVSGATTMSLPVKEALACSTAVVRSGDKGEDVEDGVSGFLVDPADTKTTGSRLAELLADPERAARMGSAGRSKVIAMYHWDRVVDVVDAALEAL